MASRSWSKNRGTPMECVRPCEIAMERSCLFGATSLKTRARHFKRAKPEFFHEPSQRLKNLSFTIVTTFPFSGFT